MYTMNAHIINTTETGLIIIVPGEPVGSSLKLQQEIRIRLDRIQFPELGSAAADHLDMYLSVFHDTPALVTVTGAKDRTGALIAEVSLTDTERFPKDHLNLSDRLAHLGYVAYVQEGGLFG